MIHAMLPASIAITIALNKKTAETWNQLASMSGSAENQIIRGGLVSERWGP